MFDSTKEDLKELLKKVKNGTLQLPDFQRDYVWGDEAVKSLIASVAKGYPVGAILTMVTGGEVRFKPRPLAGVKDNGKEPEVLLLDGQQRMTSLFQAMFTDRPVRTRTHRGTEVERFYYLDIEQAVSGTANMEEAIFGVPADKIVRSNFGKDIKLDLSTREAEFHHKMFPLREVYNSRDWSYGWRDYWKAQGQDVSDLDKEFVTGVVESIERYEMPLIRLSRDNSREAICLVFEKVNVGGKKLDTFELVTAIYAADEYDLREDWNGPQTNRAPGRRARMIGSPNRRDVLTKIASTDFLQACSLLHTRENRLAKDKDGLKGKELPQVSCRRDAVLGLPLEAFRKHADALEQGFIEAGGFLNEQKIVWHRDVPYPPLIVALASTFAILGRDSQNAASKEKLAKWFWSVTLGELYGSTTESRLARDVPELVDWIKGGDSGPRSLEEALFQSVRLLSLRSRTSAAYKGLHALLMRRGCQDFITGRPTDIMTFFDDKIDIHHIFPQDWCKKPEQGIDRKIYDSIVNKTPLSKSSNITIGGNAPSVYLKRIQEKQGISPDALDNILRTHLIDPEHLRTDDFEAFFQARMKALGSLVAEAMDKAVVEEQGGNEPEVEVPDSELEAEEEQEVV